MTGAAQILIVDDEQHIRTSLSELLTRDGHQVYTAASGELALELFDHQTFDLVLLDLKLGGIGGIEVLAGLRQRSPETVVIVLTGHGSLETAVETIRLGAHDYLFKPVKSTELRESVQKGLAGRLHVRQRQVLEQLDQLTNCLAEIRASIMLRQELVSDGSRPMREHERFLQKGELFVDLARHVITLDGHELDLSPTEFNILVYLARQAPRVIPAEELLREVNGYETESWDASETVRQHIYRLRQKLKETAGRADLVATVRGVGYTLKTSA